MLLRINARLKVSQRLLELILDALELLLGMGATTKVANAKVEHRKAQVSRQVGAAHM